MTKWAYQENEDGSAVFMQGIHLSPAQKREDDGGVGGALRTLSMEVGQYLLCWMRDNNRGIGTIIVNHWQANDTVWMRILFSPLEVKDEKSGI